MSPLLIGLLAFVAVSAVVGGVVMLFSNKGGGTRVEDRLQMLTSANSGAGRDAGKESSVLSRPLNESVGMLERILQRFGNIQRLFDQADSQMTVPKLGLISGALAIAASGGLTIMHANPALLPVAAIFAASLPLLWLMFRRSRRLKKFGAQLPEALEMMARVLRAGQSLSFGFNVVSTELPAPIGPEFGRVFEEQNLGIPVEESLHSVCDRVPNLDLKFFATAVILQRQTGGDLAEILDKIGALVRERFRIWGQIQALTGEGRLSGVVLLGLPFLLFGAVYKMNPEYIQALFTDPMGKQMLAVALIMQVLGALLIRKIVNIKVEEMFASPGMFNSETLTTIGLFGAFAALAWWVMDLMMSNKPRAIERLDELKNPRARRSTQAEAMLKKPDTMARMLEKTTALVKPLQPKDAAQAGILKDRLAAAGFRSEGMVAIFMGLKVIGLCAGLFLGGGTVLSLRGMNQTTLMYTAVLVGIFFWLPDIVLGLIGSSRKQAIFLALPDALDMMVVCVEAGLGLDQAMRKVSEEMKSSYPVLSEEFALTNFQLQMGRTRADALREFGARCGVSDLRALAGVLIQADKFGSGIAQALRTQSEAMRTRRRQIAEEKAAKTAVKLIFPLVVFIFPGIFVILVGPAAIHMVRDMFPKMSGG